MERTFRFQGKTIALEKKVVNFKLSILHSHHGNLTDSELWKDAIYFLHHEQ